MDSFVFYESFAEAAATLGDKARLKLYDAVVKLGLSCAEDETTLNQVCADIESSLAQSRNVFAQFLLIKPQILANFKRKLNGRKGAEFGALGGAPKGNTNATKNNPKTTPNVNVNVNVNDNVNGNKIDSADALSKYAYEGKVIRLTKKDFDAWKEMFPDLNLRPELMMRDDWLSKQDQGEKKRWYMSTMAYFTKRNEQRKAQNADFAEPKEVNEDECWF